MANKLLTVLPLVLVLPLCLTTGCGGDDGGSLYSGTSNSGVTLSGADSTTYPGDGDPTGDGDPSGDGDPTTSSGIKLDVVGGEEMGTATTAGDAGNGNGCQKVDFLFVIDNSGSMLEEQNNLAGSFPSFINSIQSTLDAAQDYHIMVIDTDAWVYSGCPLPVWLPLARAVCRATSAGSPSRCSARTSSGPE